MIPRFNNVLSCIFLRPWLGVPFGIWLAVSVAYFWWLICRINVLENQNKVIKSELRISRSSIQFHSVDSAPQYRVPVIPDESGTLCETIHISLVCMNKCSRQITPMLKSLLYHRQNPVHFHVIVDFASERIISTLFDTWDLPDVKYNCYNANSDLPKVQWVPNNHYSGVYALLKLLFPEILPSTIHKVIVLDSDLTFLSDISELWSMFRNMSGEQFIGLVENESNWYLETSKRWPALGRGYNTGVMLLDLKKMRDIQWGDLWQRAVNDNINILKHTMLADQDVINAIIRSKPDIVYNISCQYNVQMSTQTISKNCYREDINNVKIIHWNSPLKYDIKVRDADYFRNNHMLFMNMDGTLLREKMHRCHAAEATTMKINNSDLCTSFRTVQRMKLRTHLYYMDYSYDSVDSFDVTLVLQLSMDRLQFLERLVKFWDGPLSAAIYLSDCDVREFESFIQDWSDTLSNRKNIGYHLVFKHDSVHYPVNYLRNVALENVNTPYVFLMDVDFVPMVGLYPHLRKVLRLINPYPQKKCLVVAAFETQRYRASPPRSKAALAARLGGVAGAAGGAAGAAGGGAGAAGGAAGAAGGVAGGGAARARNRSADIAPFRSREWPRGHRATDYARWVTATAPYRVEWESDYEPYLVVHRSVPKYDTRFSGFGWNKVSHSVELRARGWAAWVLPAAFVLHTPHAPSPDITKFRADTHYRVCLALLKQEFMEDLRRKYNITFEEASKPDSVYIAQAQSLYLNQIKKPTK